MDEYPYSESFEGRSEIPQVGNKVVVYNRYITSEPFEVTVVRVISPDRLSGGVIFDENDNRFPLSVVYKREQE